MDGQIILGLTLLLLGVVLNPFNPIASYIFVTLAIIIIVIDYFLDN